MLMADKIACSVASMYRAKQHEMEVQSRERKRLLSPYQSDLTETVPWK